MTVNKGGGGAPACAACKYQRRKCTSDCLLAPHFPASDSRTFQNVHRLFGVSNVTKTLKSLAREDLRQDAMTSMIYEAAIRRRFPVLGCSHIINKLLNDISWAYSELRYVNRELDFYRNRGGDEVMVHSEMFSDEMMGMTIDQFEHQKMMMVENHLKGIRNEVKLDQERSLIFYSSPSSGDGSFLGTNFPVEDKEAFAQVDLKTAAAAFSLTTVN